MGEAPHHVDVHIAGDTQQFDEMSSQEMSEAMKAFLVQSKRLGQLVSFFGQNNQHYLMLADAWLGKCVLKAETMTIAKILEDKLGVSPETFLKMCAEELDRHLSLLEIEHKIIITEDGVIRPENQDAGKQ